jgi:hypothetical protein
MLVVVVENEYSMSNPTERDLLLDTDELAYHTITAELDGSTST